MYCNAVILNGFLPVMITMIFGCLAYRYVRQLAFQTLPVVRQELDKQLTTMLLIQVILNCLTTVPYMIIVALFIPSHSDANLVVTLSQSSVLTAAICLYYFNCSVSAAAKEREREMEEIDLLIF